MLLDVGFALLWTFFLTPLCVLCRTFCSSRKKKRNRWKRAREIPLLSCGPDRIAARKKAATRKKLIAGSFAELSRGIQNPSTRSQCVRTIPTYWARVRVTVRPACGGWTLLEAAPRFLGTRTGLSTLSVSIVLRPLVLSVPLVPMVPCKSSRFRLLCCIKNHPRIF